MTPSSWNSLEIAKLLVGALTPLMLALFGIYIHRITKRFEHLQWRSQKLIDKRLEIYDDLAPSFNDLLCYFTYVGSWRDLEPPRIVSMKRELDKKIHLAAPLFSEEFFKACTRFQQLCFETYTGWGHDALLRTQFERRQEALGNRWDKKWESCFSRDVSNPNTIRDAYRSLMEVFARDIGVHEAFVVPPTGLLPRHLR